MLVTLINKNCDYMMTIFHIYFQIVEDTVNNENCNITGILIGQVFLCVLLMSYIFCVKLVCFVLNFYFNRVQACYTF